MHSGKPHVRALLLYEASEHGIIFHTLKSQDLYKQLTMSPDVELCFINDEQDREIRISGSVEFLEDETLKKEIVARRELLQPWILQHGYQMLAVMRLKNGTAQIWEPEVTLLPRIQISL